MSCEYDPSSVTSATARPLRGHVLDVTSRGAPGLAPAERIVTDHLTRLGATLSPRGPGDDAFRATLRGVGPGLPAVRSVLHGWGGLGDGPFDETVAQARLGLMAVHGRARGGPHRLALDYLSTVGALVAVQGTLAAVLGALRGRPVEGVETSVAHAGLLCVGQYVAAATAAEEPERSPATGPDAAPSPPFTSANGVRFEVEALTAQPWLDFWDALGVERCDIGASWRPFLGRYAHAVAPVRQSLTAAAGRHTWDEIAEHARRTGISVCRLRSVLERIDDNDVRCRATPWEIREFDGDLPAAAHVGASGHPPCPGGEGPLAGLRVVESTRRIQGPLATHLLGLLGAEIIRIEPPGGDPLRGVPPMAGDCSARFVTLNRGKHVEEIDITSTSGRSSVLKLIDDADVFLHNWAPGKAAALGLDHADMAAVNPDLVYARASAWGRRPGGERPLGTDFMVQAWSGVAAALPDADGRGAGSLVTLLDLLGGHLAAEGILAALICRERGDRAVRVDTSLLGASTVLLGDLLGQVPHVAPETGLLLPTAEGTLAVSAGHDTVAGHLLGSSAPVAVLHAALATRSAAHWRDVLLAAGVPAAVLCTDVGELPADPLLAPAYTSDGCALPTSPWRFS